MFLKVLLSLVILLSVVSWSDESKVYVPTVKGSYRTIGEIILHDDKGQRLMTFEENFDQNAHVTSFWSLMDGKNVTVLENLNVGDIQSFQYDVKEGTCKKFTPNDWGKTDVTMRLRPSQDVNGQLIFPIRELLSLTVDDLAKNGWANDMITFRGVLTDMFTFDVKSGSDDLEVEAYWSDLRGGSSMSSFKEVPLGFVIRRVISPDEKIIDHVINIFYFSHGEVNKQMLQPIRGIYCPERSDPDPYPDLKRYKNLAWSVEFTWAEKELTTSVDAWVDMESKMLRVDFQPLETLSGVVSPPESLVISFDEQVAFHINQNGKGECVVAHLDQEPYYPQMVMDPKKQANWIPEEFFGTKSNKFVRIGQTVERGVPCGIYQTQRTDWPPGETKVKSVWEWCFANNLLPEVKLQQGQLPLISLNIYVTESPYELDTKAKPYKGQQISYHFYNVREMEPNRMETVAFDISPCFPGSRQLTVSFLVELMPNEREIVMQMDSDVKFNSLWRQEAYIATKMSPTSLRITRVRSGFQDTEGPLVVQLTILDQHGDLPHRVENFGIDVVKSNLEAAINGARFGIMYTTNTSSIALDAKPGSLQVEPGQDGTLMTLPLAYFRTQAHIERVRAEKEAKESSARATPWIVGVFCLQIGVAIGVIGVVLRKRKSREDQIQLVNEQPSTINA